MPPYPTPSEYQEAIQFPETAFADAELQAATPRENALGLPQPVTGAFAAVFPMRARSGRLLAAKCFLAGVEDQPRRYRAIARHLEKEGWPYAVPFAYQREGVQVGGEEFPLLKMEWVEGVPLSRYVEARLEEPEALRRLAEAWAKMLERLDAAGIAHGDLQHGNVLVSEEADGAPRLTLVDYDTMFVPALKGRTSAEVGHRNFQHPDRTERDFGPHLDRFAGLVVGVALEALRLRPDLWRKYDTGENLLFRAADFYDPAASPLFAELEEIEALAGPAQALRTACYLEPAAVPKWDDVRAGEAPARRPPNQAVRQRRRARSAERGAFARWFLPGVAAALAGAAALWAAGWWLGALVWLALSVTALAGAGAHFYRRQPVVRRRRRLRQEADYFAQVIENLERQIASLEAQRQGVRATVDERRAARLDELREEALYDRLKYHFIGEVGTVEGLSHKTVVRLKASGIRTAHQATPERLRGIRQMGEASKARVALWRAALVSEYEGDLPKELTPAEDRRVRRYVAHRIESLDAEVQRAREKIAVQKMERAEAERRLGSLPALSPARYLRYLIRLATLPSPEAAPTPSAKPPQAPPAPTPQSIPENDEAPWWRQG